MAQNFLSFERDQPMLLPPDLRDWLDDDHLAWFVIEAIEELDLEPFYASHRADGHGRAAHEASVLRPSHFKARDVALHSSSMAAAATLIMWFHLRSPELAEDFERLMASDRDIVRGSLDTMSDWRLTRPTDVPGQASESADYVLIAEIVNIERWQKQAEQRVQSLADDLAHLVSSRRMLVLERVL
jgi:hypothetical protein